MSVGTAAPASRDAASTSAAASASMNGTDIDSRVETRCSDGRHVWRRIGHSRRWWWARYSSRSSFVTTPAARPSSTTTTAGAPPDSRAKASVQGARPVDRRQRPVHDLADCPLDHRRVPIRPLEQAPSRSRIRRCLSISSPSGASDTGIWLMPKQLEHVDRRADPVRRPRQDDRRQLAVSVAVPACTSATRTVAASTSRAGRSRASTRRCKAWTGSCGHRRGRSRR